MGLGGTARPRISVCELVRFANVYNPKRSFNPTIKTTCDIKTFANYIDQGNERPAATSTAKTGPCQPLNESSRFRPLMTVEYIPVQPTSGKEMAIGSPRY